MPRSRAARHGAAVKFLNARLISAHPELTRELEKDSDVQVCIGQLQAEKQRNLTAFERQKDGRQYKHPVFLENALATGRQQMSEST